LTYDLWTPKADNFLLLLYGTLVPIYNKTGSFVKYHVHKIGNGQMQEPVESIMPAASLRLSEA